MKKSEADALLRRLTELEARLAAAEARIAVLEARAPAILPPVFLPTPPPEYVPPSIPWRQSPITTCGQQDLNDGALPLTFVVTS